MSNSRLDLHGTARSTATIQRPRRAASSSYTGNREHHGLTRSPHLRKRPALTRLEAKHEHASMTPHIARFRVHEGFWFGLARREVGYQKGPLERIASFGTDRARVQVAGELRV